MFIIIGYIVVIASTLTAFVLAGGKPLSLFHLPEVIALGGITLGVVDVCTPKDVIIRTIGAMMKALKGGGPSKEDYLDLMKIMYEMFMLGCRYGLLALDEHVSAPGSSSIFQNGDGCPAIGSGSDASRIRKFRYDDIRELQVRQI